MIYFQEITYAHHNTTQQLWTWMHWNSGKQKHASNKPDVNWLKDTMGKHKGHILQAVKLYQQCYKDKIEKHMKAEFNLHGGTTNKEQMGIHCRVVLEMWKGEDEDIIAEITGEVEAEKQKKKGKKDDDEEEEEKEEKEASNKDERSPEEYDVFIILFHTIRLLNLLLTVL
jgi:hypothetical protein